MQNSVKINLLSNQEAAALLGIRPDTLKSWRNTKAVNIPYVRIGARVKYDIDVLKTFINTNTINHEVKTK